MKNLRKNFAKKAAPEKAIKPDLGDLPYWNLDSLYPGIDSEKMQADLALMQALASDFNEAYEGVVAKIPGAVLGDAIAEYEKIENIQHSIYSYLYLLEAEDRGNIPKNEAIKKQLAEIGGSVGFFTSEIASMEQNDLIVKMAAPELARYAPWIGRLRTDYGSTLADGIEGLSIDYDEASGEGWRRFYGAAMAEIKVEWQGKSILLDDAELMMAETDRPLTERLALRKVIGDGLKKNSPRIALAYNSLMKDWLIDGDMRGFARADQPVNISNMVSPDIVDAMYDTGKASYAKLSQKFYRWKADMHGEDSMSRAALRSPLPDMEQQSARIYSWDESRKIVLRALRKFSPKFGRLAQKMFDENHIDAGTRPAKEGGAFCMPTGPDNFPFILLNHTGSADDVCNGLGHELGHAVHQALSEKARGCLLSEMPTALAEIASIFAEMLVFEEMLKEEKNETRKRQLLVDKVENMLGNGLQQLAYYDFERRVFDERRGGEVDAERISDIWLETQKEYFGPAVELDDCDRYRWMSVPHFFSTPFYVYSYAFAQVMVCGLYQAYKTAESEGPAAREEFIENYIELLETGITKNIPEMFSPFDLEPDTPEFWQGGLQLIDDYLRELTKTPEPKAALKQKFSKSAAPKGTTDPKKRPPRAPRI